MLDGTWNHSSSETGSITIASGTHPITHTPQPMHLSRSTTDLPGSVSGTRLAGGRDDGRHPLRSLGNGVHRAAEDAGAARGARLGIDDRAVVGLLGRFRRAGELLAVEDPAAARAAVARADKLRRLRAHGEAVEREVDVPHLLEPQEKLRRLFPVEHRLAERGLRRQPDKAAALHGLAAAVPVQQFHLPLADAGNDEEALVPREVGVDVECGSRSRYSGFSEPRTGTTPRTPGRGDEDPLAPALDHELLEQFGELLVLEPHHRFVPADEERTQPVPLDANVDGARPGAAMPGESSRTRRRGIRLSSIAVTSASSRPTLAAIAAAVSGVRVKWPASQTSSGGERRLDQFQFDAGRRSRKAVRKRVQRAGEPFVDVLRLASFRTPGAPERLVDDRLEVPDQFVGRRLVVVQLVDLAEKLVLAEAEAVIRQQFVVDHVLVRADERQDRPDVLLVVVDARESAACGR